MIIQKRKNRLISIDPSINNLGLAVWDLDTKKVIMHMLVHPEKKYTNNEYDKSYSMLEIVKKWRLQYGVNKIILEVPDHWAVGGFEARETGSMVKLAFVCGVIYSLRDEIEQFVVAKPREWKAQLSKKVVANRLQDHYLKQDINMKALNENVMDAIAIGHFYIYGSV